MGRAPRVALALYALALGLPGLASIPPVDRDEAYFSQAARQMLESRDFIDIRFQNQPRYVKPILAYWMQAASAAAFGGPGHDRIWAYRLPSLLATVAAVLILFEIALVFLDARAALVSSALIAGTLLLQTQSHQARADALLFLCIAGCMWPLARAYRAIDDAARFRVAAAALPSGLVALFWISLSAGLLIKGPVAPVIVLLTAGGLALTAKQIRWLAALRPRLGLAILALTVIPWPAAMLATHGFAFFATAAESDLWPKLAGGQESHGAPPLSHLLLLPASLWPATLLLPQALWFAWHRRSERLVQFCLAWCLPGWLLFELIPTKLPHYVLPLLPAIALLAAGSTRDGLRVTPGIARLGTAVFALIGAALVAGAGVAVAHLGRGADFATIATGALLLGAIGIAIRESWRHPGTPPLSLPACALLASIFLYGVVGPRLERIWVTARTATVVRSLASPERCPVAVVGYPEPSFVFLLGTATRFVGPTEAAARLDLPSGGVVVVRSDLDGAVLGAMHARRAAALRRATVRGVDPVHGRRIAFSIWMSACTDGSGGVRPCCVSQAAEPFTQSSRGAHRVRR